METLSFFTILKRKISLNLFLTSITNFYRNYFQVRRKKFGYIDKTSRVRFPALIKGIENVYLYEHTHILGNSTILATKAKFVMKQKSGAAEGLTVVTGNHFPVLGQFILEAAGYNDEQIAKEVIVEEDVWIASNVTLLAGVNVGRGATIGAGAVVRNNVPPYAIIVGNPAKIVGFNFTPEEIIEHEKALYPEDKRLPIELLEKNYKKYFLDHIKEIKSYTGLTCR